MHSLSQRDPKKSICEENSAVYSYRTGGGRGFKRFWLYFRLQQAALEENQGLLLILMYELPQREA